MKNETNLWGEWWGKTDPRHLFSTLPYISVSQISFIAGVRCWNNEIQFITQKMNWRERLGKHLIRLGIYFLKNKYDITRESV